MQFWFLAVHLQFPHISPSLHPLTHFLSTSLLPFLASPQLPPPWEQFVIIPVLRNLSLVSLFHITSLSLSSHRVSCFPSPCVFPSCDIPSLIPPSLLPSTPSQLHFALPASPSSFISCLSFRFPPRFTTDRPALDKSWKNIIFEWVFLPILPGFTPVWFLRDLHPPDGHTLAVPFSGQNSHSFTHTGKNSPGG